MIPESSKDLVVLVADLDAENALRGILARHESLRIRPLAATKADFHRHVQRDPGCYGNAQNFLRPFLRTHRFALVVFDHHGSGAETKTSEEIESDVEDRLCNTGWKDRCGVIVPNPELEIWVWSDSPNVEQILGWAGKRPKLREWLIQKRLLKDLDSKPSDPKEAMLASLREQQVPLSARLFRNLADQVSFDRCQDRAFLKLRQVLHTWFGVGAESRQREQT